MSSPASSSSSSSRSLCKCRVKYIGTAEPTERTQGVEAVQSPLKAVYACTDNDVNKFRLNAIDAWLTVDDTGLRLDFVTDPSHVVVFPISSLFYCCSLRFCPYNASNNRVLAPKFVFLDTSDAAAVSNKVHPPIFAAIFQRTRGKTSMECHSFVCNTDQAALMLVEACQQAYGITQADVPQKGTKFPLFYRYQDDDLSPADSEILEIPNKPGSLIYAALKNGEDDNNNKKKNQTNGEVAADNNNDNFGPSFFYGTKSTSIGEFAFNPTTAKRMQGYTLPRAGGAPPGLAGGGGGGGPVLFSEPGLSGPQRPTVVRRVMLKPGEIPPHMEPAPDYLPQAVVKRKR